MTATIFIDGAAGTTGLEIRERLAGRAEFALVTLSDGERKDARARARALNGADAVVLCLPDEAAREAVQLIENPRTRIVDASTAHRVAQGWAYGFPELEPGGYERLAGARHISNPGCYPTGFLALVRPLIRAGLLPTDYPYTVNAVSGYSGGGRAMIAEFEDEAAANFSRAVVRTYALSLAHKHVAEMAVHAGLAHPPLFAPSVGRFYRGMMVDVPVQLWALAKRPSAADLRDALAEAYAGRPLIEVASAAESAALTTLDAETLAGTDRLRLHVFGNDASGQVRLVALLDNLGKGAAGAAVQSLNIVFGLPETAGLK